MKWCSSNGKHSSASYVGHNSLHSHITHVSVPKSQYGSTGQGCEVNLHTSIPVCPCCGVWSHASCNFFLTCILSFFFVFFLFSLGINKQLFSAKSFQDASLSQRAKCLPLKHPELQYLHCWEYSGNTPEMWLVIFFFFFFFGSNRERLFSTVTLLRLCLKWCTLLCVIINSRFCLPKWPVAKMQMLLQVMWSRKTATWQTWALVWFYLFIFYHLFPKPLIVLL